MNWISSACFIEISVGRDLATWWCCGKMFLLMKSTWNFPPENTRFKGRDARNGAFGRKRGVVRTCACVSVFVHILLIRALGALRAEVSGLLSRVLALEGLRKDRAGESPSSSQFLARCPLLSYWGGSQSLSSPNITSSSLWSH